MIRKLFIAAGLSIVMDTACSEQKGDVLSQAEEEFYAGRYESAMQLCDQNFSPDSVGNLSVSQLCRLAMLNAKLADFVNEDLNLASATLYMHSAIQRDSDSVAIFVNALEVDDRSRSAFIRQLTQAVDQKADSAIFVLPDSIL